MVTQNKLEIIKFNIHNFEEKYARPLNSVELLAVTKSQSTKTIEALLAQGQALFGENKIQEAASKWTALKLHYPHIELHLIGHLQTNKVRESVALFDVIQTLDSFKLAKKLMAEEERQKKHLTYYLEINIGKELQKTGVLPENVDEFLHEMRSAYTLNIQGIMCIPPKEQDPSPYFQKMRDIAHTHNLPVISMGMSEDYEIAIQFGCTMVRIGRALLS
jgi:PLP dependent protein